MFPMDNLRLPPVAVATAEISSIPSLVIWHARLGYASSFWVQHLASRGLLGSVPTENFNCVSCQLGKQPTLPFNTSESMSTNIFNQFILMSGGLLLSLVLVDLDILLSLLMIILAIAGFFI